MALSFKVSSLDQSSAQLEPACTANLHKRSRGCSLPGLSLGSRSQLTIRMVVPVLFMCDFPPSNLRGGTVLINRLLEKYPANSLTVLTGSHFDKISPVEERLPCKHLVFPTTNARGRWGLGRIKTLIDWLLIPVLVIYGLTVVHSSRSRVIVTIAHGHFFVAAALSALFAGKPFILIIHDDWVAELMRSALVLKYLCLPVFQLVATRAAHVYVVSPYMQEMMLAKYGVKSEVQMPAIEPPVETQPLPPAPETDRESLKIIYAGTLCSATDDSFNLLLRLVKGDKLLGCGIKAWELHLYVLATPEEVTAAGWDHDRIKFHGWATQDELRRALATADVLFLPYSFREEERHATARAFPSKTADYLKSGRPILILAPPYSSVVRYAKQFGFADVVDEPSEEQLAQSIARIWNSAAYREELSINSRTALNANHDINKQRAEFYTLLKHLANETAKPTIPNPA
jgi:glycosyltransferase involved in cell wall biosynthesis